MLPRLCIIDAALELPRSRIDMERVCCIWGTMVRERLVDVGDGSHPAALAAKKGESDMDTSVSQGEWSKRVL